MTAKRIERIKAAVQAIHDRGEYPSRSRLKAELKTTSMPPEVNEVRLAEIRRLGLEVILAKAGYIQ